MPSGSIYFNNLYILMLTKCVLKNLFGNTPVLAWLPNKISFLHDIMLIVCASCVCIMFYCHKEDREREREKVAERWRGER